MWEIVIFILVLVLLVWVLYRAPSTPLLEGFQKALGIQSLADPFRIRRLGYPGRID